MKKKMKTLRMPMCLHVCFMVPPLLSASYPNGMLCHVWNVELEPYGHSPGIKRAKPMHSGASSCQDGSCPPYNHTGAAAGEE